MILEPQQILYFNNLVYAARAPSDVGAAVIGVLPGNMFNGTASNSQAAAPEEEEITYADIADLFSPNPVNWAQFQQAGEQITFSDLQNLFSGNPVDWSRYPQPGDMVTEADIQDLFGDNPHDWSAEAQTSDERFNEYLDGLFHEEG